MGYPNPWGYLKDLYQQPALAEAVERDQIKGRYHATDEGTNAAGIVPNAAGIVPKGPTIDSGSPTSLRAMQPTRG